MVGAVLVHQDLIIGEGYHEYFGGPHAEVNCLKSVPGSKKPLIPFSTLYVSLEPCCHYGKTPPCTDLILRERIPRVVIGCRDPFALVDGKGIEKLLANGISVEYPVLETESKEKNCRFFTFHQQNRPYVILKWAESANHKIATGNGGRMQISNALTNRLVHKWRTEEAGILVGTNTVLSDNPELTARWWPGKNPVRIVTDQQLRLPDTLKFFDGSVPTIILNGKLDFQSGERIFKKIEGEMMEPASILSTLHSLRMMSILVEGGAKLLQSFIDGGFWDEVRIITNRELEIPGGIASPELSHAKFSREEVYGSDTIRYYGNLEI
jgi:diaminohydroxyphosphoribosylaminopyrimidine deaminase/5-amino-6-(5-phosphoribosylamino)uracil reductase